MLTTGSKNLDELLGGGIERGVLTQVYGVFASGKTTLAMQVGLLNEGKVAYVDTEGGFSPERLEQMAYNWGLRGALEKFILFEPSDFREQKKMIAGLKKIVSEKFSLIVVDSITSLYRTEEKKHELLNELSKQLQVLLWLARKHNLGVIVINQVYFDSSAKTLKPLAEHTLGYKCKDILRLETLPRPSYRLAVLERHRFRPEGGMVHFRITDRGIEDID
ncbi:DNA repair and recombination protein RadB [Thermococci archaeon]|uniref:DNA repair and recombination protein RadB n=1 Tax=Palaeococcus sp. (in: euryarchaeotes) TaxID=2820298 RepID=UPI000F11445E|nr:DNA repair and recombination protein RadB [Palaeococcus sp. (in: euryarchaeotes)]MCD6559270.1 DNA repair and recombination protein RadB [Palaeococcus sp. (in: euryarchaeotes)]RLF75354.1 MAG: DNA repair and recombination protein RadB [Thermococci archaeon]RLF90547.1 MAG: DNA repair and recombination protein RadB [Thermococci archaeon]